jgi:predicted nucleic acid-binding protein
MSLLISDANIFIDFEIGGLTNELFSLPDTIGVPDLLYAEELQEQHEGLLRLGLLLMELTSQGIQRTAELAAVYRRPSRLDLAALALAEQERCRLLTGDKDLRTAAEAEGVDVRGTLWLCERLVLEKITTIDRLETAYLEMKNRNRRLPWKEVDQQLRDLRQR